MHAQILNEQLAIRMTVFDVAGDKLGTLVSCDAYGLVVSQGFFFPTEFAVPMAAVARVDADGVWLSLTKDELRQEAWDDALPTSAVASAAILA